jgi:phage terminase large subunit-like protein
VVKFTPIDGAPYKFDYPAIFRKIARDRDQAKAIQTYRKLCLEDLFFLLFWGLQREDVNKPFIVQAVREVEEENHNTLDLWAREHYKSTILTYGLPLQELIKNPEERIGIFSHTRPIAKGFLRQIKQALESDLPIKKWFKDIFWAVPRRQSPKWSEDDGLVIKRKSHPKEASIEAWGMIDGHPTSKHFTVRIYDDVVTKDSVTTPEQIKKVEDAYELSHSLGTDQGRKRVVGTHYHFADLYMKLRKSGGYKARIKPATHDGTPTGTPVLLSDERLAELLREQGPYIFACQQLLNPVAAGQAKFKHEWIKHYDRPPLRLNKYILCDPANEKKKSSDFTVMAVIGVDHDKNRFLLDAIRAKLNLTERWEALKTLYIKHKPVLRVGYEKYGMQADDQYFAEKMRQEKVFFHVTPLAGQTGKVDRIERLVPLFANGQFWLPYRLPYRDPDTGAAENLISIFIDDEFLTFPFSIHDDILDCLSRIEDEDMRVSPPLPAMMPTQEVAVTEYNEFAVH